MSKIYSLWKWLNMYHTIESCPNWWNEYNCNYCVSTGKKTGDIFHKAEASNEFHYSSLPIGIHATIRRNHTQTRINVITTVVTEASSAISQNIFISRIRGHLRYIYRPDSHYIDLATYLTTHTASGGAGGIAPRSQIYMGAPIGEAEIHLRAKLPTAPLCSATAHNIFTIIRRRIYGQRPHCLFDVFSN